MHERSAWREALQTSTAPGHACGYYTWVRHGNSGIHLSRLSNERLIRPARPLSISCEPCTGLDRSGEENDELFSSPPSDADRSLSASERNLGRSEAQMVELQPETAQ